MAQQQKGRLIGKVIVGSSTEEASMPVVQLCLTVIKKRFFGFGLVGVGVMVVGIGFLYVLVRWFRIEENIAYFMQAIVSIELNFVLNKFINWRDREGKILQQWIKFHTTKIGTVIFNQVLFGCLVYLGVHFLIATFIGVAVATVINYVANDKFVFLQAKLPLTPIEESEQALIFEE